MKLVFFDTEYSESMAERGKRLIVKDASFVPRFGDAIDWPPREKLEPVDLITWKAGYDYRVKDIAWRYEIGEEVVVYIHVAIGKRG